MGAMDAMDGARLGGRSEPGVAAGVLEIQDSGSGGYVRYDAGTWRDRSLRQVDVVSSHLPRACLDGVQPACFGTCWERYQSDGHTLRQGKDEEGVKRSTHSGRSQSYALVGPWTS